MQRIDVCFSWLRSVCGLLRRVIADRAPLARRIDAVGG